MNALRMKYFIQNKIKMEKIKNQLPTQIIFLDYIINKWIMKKKLFFHIELICSLARIRTEWRNLIFEKEQKVNFETCLSKDNRNHAYPKLTDVSIQINLIAFSDKLIMELHNTYAQSSQITLFFNKWNKDAFIVFIH